LWRVELGLEEVLLQMMQEGKCEALSTNKMVAIKHWCKTGCCERKDEVRCQVTKGSWLFTHICRKATDSKYSETERVFDDDGVCDECVSNRLHP